MNGFKHRNAEKQSRVKPRLKQVVTFKRRFLFVKRSEKVLKQSHQKNDVVKELAILFVLLLVKELGEVSCHCKICMKVVGLFIR